MSLCVDINLNIVGKSGPFLFNLILFFNYANGPRSTRFPLFPRFGVWFREFSFDDSHGFDEFNGYDGTRMVFTRNTNTLKNLWIRRRRK